MTVYALNTPVAYSSVPFENGKIYKSGASGTAWANTQINFDAKYSWNYGDGGDPSTEWTDSVLHYEDSGPQLLDLYVNGNNIDWGAYQSNHVYEKKITGTGDPATFWFQIYDSYPINNYDYLTVNIYECN